MHSRKEKTLSTIMLIGFGLLILSVFLVILIVVMPIPGLHIVTGGSFLLGVILTVYGLVAGSITVRGGIKPSKEPQRIDTCRVMAKYAIDKYEEMVFEDLDIREGLRFYIKLWFPDGRQNEFRCAYEVYEHCHDGMYGSAMIQGDWLGQFNPKAAPTNPSGNPYDR